MSVFFFFFIFFSSHSSCVRARLFTPVRIYCLRNIALCIRAQMEHINSRLSYKTRAGQVTPEWKHSVYSKLILFFFSSNWIITSDGNCKQSIIRTETQKHVNIRITKEESNAYKTTYTHNAQTSRIILVNRYAQSTISVKYTHWIGHYIVFGHW